MRRAGPEHRGGELGKGPGLLLGLGQQRQGDQGVGGEEIEGDRAVALVAQDPIQGAAARGGELCRRGIGPGGRSEMLTDPGPERGRSRGGVAVQPLGWHA